MMFVSVELLVLFKGEKHFEVSHNEQLLHLIYSNEKSKYQRPNNVSGCWNLPTRRVQLLEKCSLSITCNYLSRYVTMAYCHRVRYQLNFGGAGLLLN